ncbi:thioesterase II family protein [Streptomyces sp. WMMC897]|uniref:thioesterase II family protein n=1 Tax=Streptomyces sp. WMMC897 TaxID=3014782 RepID=UPI0022B6F95D|nr:alpha/beta fold hydrolase [Streptomyces sp. WMMC897]MCZ7414350.1 alpha/beta fold hydrolase [Streptomyces sp. WMMC897]
MTTRAHDRPPAGPERPARRWLGGRTPDPGAAFRLYCFPCAGGSAAMYRSWQERAPSHVEVRPVELPGHGRRLGEDPFLGLPPLVRALTEDLAGELHRPFALFGHSMGGLIAFELARALRERGLPQPAHLFLAATASPERKVTRTALHAASDEEVLDELRAMGGTPRELLDDRELMDLAIPTLRADYALLHTYEYREKPPLPVPFTVLGGAADTITPPTSLPGWRRHTTGGTDLRTLPGGHFFVQDTVPEIMAAVRAALPVHGPSVTG